MVLSVTITRPSLVEQAGAVSMVMESVDWNQPGSTPLSLGWDPATWLATWGLEYVPGSVQVNQGSGFAAATFVDIATGQAFIGFGASRPAELGPYSVGTDMADGAIGADITPNAYILAKQYVKDSGYTSPYLTGPSLGGGEAGYAASVYGDPGISFGAPGQPGNTILNTPNFIAAINVGDPVGTYASGLNGTVLGLPQYTYGTPVFGGSPLSGVALGLSEIGLSLSEFDGLLGVVSAAGILYELNENHDTPAYGTNFGISSLLGKPGPFGGSTVPNAPLPSAASLGPATNPVYANGYDQNGFDSNGYNVFGRNQFGALDPSIAASGGAVRSDVINGATVSVTIHADGSATATWTFPNGVSETDQYNTSGLKISTDQVSPDGSGSSWSLNTGTGAIDANVSSASGSTGNSTTLSGNFASGTFTSVTTSRFLSGDGIATETQTNTNGTIVVSVIGTPFDNAFTGYDFSSPGAVQAFKISIGFDDNSNSQFSATGTLGSQSGADLLTEIAFLPLGSIPDGISSSDIVSSTALSNGMSIFQTSDGKIFEAATPIPSQISGSLSLHLTPSDGSEVDISVTPAVGGSGASALSLTWNTGGATQTLAGTFDPNEPGQGLGNFTVNGQAVDSSTLEILNGLGFNLGAALQSIGSASGGNFGGLVNSLGGDDAGSQEGFSFTSGGGFSFSPTSPTTPVLVSVGSDNSIQLTGLNAQGQTIELAISTPSGADQRTATLSIGDHQITALVGGDNAPGQITAIDGRPVADTFSGMLSDQGVDLMSVLQNQFGLQPSAFLNDLFGDANDGVGVSEASNGDLQFSATIDGAPSILTPVYGDGSIDQAIVTEPSGNADDSFSLDGIVFDIQSYLSSLGLNVQPIDVNDDGSVDVGGLVTSIAEEIGNTLIQSVTRGDVPASILLGALTTTAIQEGSIQLSGSSYIGLGAGLTNFAETFALTLGGSVGGYFGSELGGQLSKDIGIDPQIGAFVGSNLGNAAFEDITQLAAAQLFQMGPTSFGSLLENGLSDSYGAFNASYGAFAGQELASLAGFSNSLPASVGADIGGLVGGALIPIPFLGTIIGAFIGDIIGALIEGTPKSVDTITLTDQDQFAITAADVGGGADAGIGQNMAQDIVGILNAVLGDVGGIVANIVPTLSFSVGLDGMSGNTPKYIFLTALGRTNFRDPTSGIEAAAITALKQIEIQGGDIYLKRAIANTDATTIAGLQDDLQVARDYEAFVNNPALFQVALESSDDPTIGQKWEAELVRAQELGLFAISAPSDTYSRAADVAAYAASLGTSTPVTVAGGYAANSGDGHTLLSGSGDATIVATGSVDVLVAGTGNDTLIANGNGATLLGLAATSTLIATGMADALVAGSGSNVLVSNGSGNTLLGGAGADSITANGAGDTLLGGTGAATITANGTNEIAIGGSGSATITAVGNTNLVEGGAGNDTLLANGDNNAVVAGSGTDLLIVTGDNNEVGGGTGNDTFVANGADNVLAAGSGSDTLIAIGTNNTLVGIVTTSVLDALGAANTLAGGFGNDLIYATGSDEVVFGSTGDDKIAIDGAKGTIDYSQLDAPVTINLGRGTVLKGNNNYDLLTGAVIAIGAAAGGNTLIGAGNGDTLEGGAGNDTFIGGATDFASFALSTAAVDVNLSSGSSAGGDANNDVFEINNIIGSGFGDVLVGNAGSDTLAPGGGDNTVLAGAGFTVVDYTDAPTGIVADLSRETATNGYGGIDILDNVENVFGSAIGTNTIVGNNSSNVLGGRGTLLGNGGTDTYIFQANYGQEVIDNFGGTTSSILEIGAGIASSDVTASRTNNDLYLMVANSSDVIEVQDYFNQFYYLGAIQFSDGTSWDYSTVLGLVDTPSVSNHVLLGDSASNTLDGYGGNDTLIGNGGTDTFVFGSGYGQEVVSNFGGTTSSVLEIKAGIDPSDVTASRIDNDLYLRIADSSDVVQVQDYFNQFYYLGAIQFSDGTSWNYATVLGLVDTPSVPNHVLLGDSASNTLDGYGGNDTLIGNGGTDTFVFGSGYGQEVVSNFGGTTSSVLEIKAGIDPSDVTASRIDNDLYLRIADSSDVVQVQDYFNQFYYLGAIQFSDGTSWDYATVLGLVDTPSVPNHVLLGDSASNTLDGYGGNDTLIGNGGTDTFVFGSGYGQEVISNFGGTTSSVLEIKAGIDPSDVHVAQIGNDLYLRIADSSDVVQVQDYFDESYYQLGAIQFSDGTTWGSTDVSERLATPQTLVSSGDGSTLDGDGGDATLIGDSHANTYVFGSGYGHEYIQAVAGKNDHGVPESTLLLKDLTLADVTIRRTNDDIILDVDGTEDSVTLTYYYADNASQVLNAYTTIEFSDGSVLDYATALAEADTASTNNQILISDGNSNVLDGSVGNDTLIGSPDGAGTSTYLYGLGYGQDLIENNSIGVTESVLLFKSDVDPADVLASRSGDDLVLRVAGTQSQVTVSRYFSDLWTADLNGAVAVQFAGGTVWSYSQVLAMVDAASDTNQTLIGDGLGSVLDGNVGNDTLIGSPDTYVSGEGATTYVFGRGYGQDLIENSGPSADSVLLMNADVTSADVVYTRINDDLIVSIAGTQSQVRIKNYFHDIWNPGEDGTIGSIKFAADGTVVSYSQVLAIVDIASDSNQTLLGDGGHNTLDGNVGNDTLIGSPDGLLSAVGYNTYLYGRGYGQDVIMNTGADTTASELVFGAGIAASDLVMSRANNDLILGIAGTQSNVTVQNFFNGWGLNIVLADGSAIPYDTILKTVDTASPTNLTLLGDGNSDVLDGNFGNDTLIGSPNGSGTTTYLFGRGYGQDIIWDDGGANLAPSELLIRSDTSSLDVQALRDGNNLVLVVAGTHSQMTVQSYFSNSNRQIPIVFADGQSWDYATVTTMVASATAGEVLYGSTGNDTLNGSGTNDTLVGNGGADTYIFGVGYGQEVIDDKGEQPNASTLLINSGTSLSSLRASRSGDDLIVSIAGSTDEALVEGYFDGLTNAAGSQGNNAFAAIVTSTGQTMSIPVGIADSLMPGYGYNAVDFLYDRGDGNETLFPNGSTNTLVMGAGISESDLSYQAAGSTLLISLADDPTDLLTIRNELDYHQVGEVVLADGTTVDLTQPLTFTWQDNAAHSTLVGSDYGTNIFDITPDTNTIIGGEVYDGSTGLNILHFDKGDGNIYVNLDGGTGVVDLAADISPDDVAIEADTSGNLTVLLKDTGDSIYFQSGLNYGGSTNVSAVNFGDGTSIDLSSPRTFTWFGTATDTSLVGSQYGTNVFDLGAGNDTVVGGYSSWGSSGLNVLNFDKGDGNVRVNLNSGTGVVDLASDIADTDVAIQADTSGNLTVLLKDTGESIYFQGGLNYGGTTNVTAVNFSDGTSIDLTAPLTFDWFGSATNTLLTGSRYGTNVFDLSPGNDTVIGGYSSFGTTGLNVFEYGKDDGNVSVNLNSGSGIIDMGAGVTANDVALSSDGSWDLIVTLKDTGESITFHSGLNYGYSSNVSEIEFSDGTTLGIDQTGFDETAWITEGSSSHETLVDAGGSSTLVGNLSGGTLVASPSSEELVYVAADVVVNLTAGTATGTAGTDTLFGFSNASVLGAADTLVGNSAGDTLSARGLNDVVVAGGNADSLFSSGIADTLIGTAGGDILDGTGSTTAIAGYTADDVVVDLSAGTASIVGTGTQDALIGISNAAALGTGDTLLAANGAASLYGDGNGNTLVAAGVDTTAAYSIDDVVIDLADGSAMVTGSLASDTLIGMSNGLVSGSNDTVLGGYSGGVLSALGSDEVIAGGAGPATLVSAGTHNTLYGGSGTDELTSSGAHDIIIAGSGEDVLESSGQSNVLVAATESDTLSTTGTGDTLIGTGTGDTLQGQEGSGAIVGLTVSGAIINLVDGTAGVAGSGSIDTLVGINRAAAFGTDGTLIGSGTGDTLDASTGTDAVIAYVANNVSVDLNSDFAAVIGSPNHDHLVDATAVAIYGEHDAISAASSTDTLLARGEDGTLIGNGAGATLDGSSGMATTALYDLTDMTVNLATGTAAPAGSVTSDTLIGISLVEVLGADDTVIGGAAASTLLAGGSNDTLIAGTGLTVALTDGTASVIDLAAGMEKTAGVAAILIGITAADAAGAGETLLGGSAPAVLTATGTADTLMSGTGTTTLLSSGIDNTLIATAAGDTLFSSGLQDVLVGTSTGDTLIGTGSEGAVATYATNAAVIDLTTGKATVVGSGTFDTLIGLSIISASGINETLIGGTASSTLLSNAAGNTLVAGSGATTGGYSAANAVVNLATGSASLHGTTTSDTLLGVTSGLVTGSDDTLIAGAASVMLTATGYGDTVIGDVGGETLNASGLYATLLAGAGAELLSTTGNFNVILGGSGSETLTARGEESTLRGGSGIDRITSSGEANVLFAGTGADTLVTTGLDDTLIGNSTGSTLVGTTGEGVVAAYVADNVTVDLADESASIAGESGLDTLSGISAVATYGTNDVVISGTTASTLGASGANDTLIAANTGDILIATGTADVLMGTAAGNTLDGSAGLSARATYTADDLTVNLVAGTARINGASDNDLLVGISVAQATGSHDTLVGGSYSATLFGGLNNDTLIAGSGGATAAYLSDNVIVDLTNDSVTSPGMSTIDTLIGINGGTVYGSDATLIGGAATGMLTADGDGDIIKAQINGSVVMIAPGTSGDVVQFSQAGALINLATGLATAGGLSDILENASVVAVSGDDTTLVGASGAETLSVGGAGSTLLAGSSISTLLATGTNDTIVGGANGDTLISATGATGAVASYSLNNVTIDLGAETAALNSSAASDTLIGISAANAAGFGDTLLAGATAGLLSTSGSYGTILGGDGSDTLSSSGLGNTLVGGAGSNLISTSGVHDTLVGGASSDLLSTSGNHDTLTAGSGSETLTSDGSFDLLSAGSGADLLTTSGHYDALVAGTGVDRLGTSGAGTTLIGGSSNDTLSSTGTANTLIAGSGANLLLSTGTADTLLGNGTGSTLDATGGANVAATYIIADVVVDLASGAAGVRGAGVSDSLIGVTTVSVFASGDTVLGGSAAGTLTADGDDEVIVAGTGSEYLIANGLNDTLIGKSDGSTLAEGTGTGSLAAYLEDNVTIDLATDTAQESGSLTFDTLVGITTVAALGTGDTLLGGATAATLFSDAAGNTLEAGSGYTTAAYGVTNLTVDLGAQTATVAGSGVSDQLVGISAAQVTADDDIIVGGSGSDQLIAAGDSDTLVATSNHTTLTASGQTDSFFGTAQGDVLIAEDGSNAVAVYTANNAVINLQTGEASLTGSSSFDSLTGITATATSGTDDTLIGGPGSTTLSGSGNSDTFIAGPGAGTLIGSGTGDTYEFNTSNATAVLMNGTIGASSSTNTLSFGSGIDDEDLWFARSGNDLDIDLVGTAKTITVDNWFSSAGAQLSELSADGLEVDTQLDSLISAMASYQSANPAFNAQTATAMPTDASLQTAIASAWHS